MSDTIKVPNNFYAIVKWAGIFIIIGGIKATPQIFLPILLALFISLMLLQPIHWLESKKVPHAISIIAVLLSFFVFIFILGDILGTSISKFSKNLPDYKEKVIYYADRNADTFDVFGIDISEDHLFKSEPGKLSGFLISGLNQIKQIIGKVFFIFLLSLFLLFELDSFPTKFSAIFSRAGNAKAKINLGRITVKLRNYLGIKSLTSFVTGLLIYLLLLLFGVKYAILWGVLAFLLNYIPNIGSMIAAIPAVIFAGIQLGPQYLLWTGLVYLAVNFIIGSLIEPRLLGKGMGLSTAVIFISLIFWGWLFGPVGMFLSVPLTMVLKVMMEGNESSRYFAILIGTKEEAEKIIEKNKTFESHAKHL